MKSSDAETPRLVHLSAIRPVHSNTNLPTGEQQIIFINPEFPDPKNTLRRSHTKSRAGCFNCKNRRVKCGEEVPSCKRCTYRGLTCEYPESKPLKTSNGAISHARRRSSGDWAVLKGIPPANTPIFTAKEIRFFHTFLTSMNHSLPLGNLSIWTHEIPQLAHDYPFLLHAILAMGASTMFGNVNDHSKTSLKGDATFHAYKAIAGFRRALASPESFQDHGKPDAMLATAYTLMAHSSQLEDGLAEVMGFGRGVGLITTKIRQDNIKTILIVDFDWTHMIPHLCALRPHDLDNTDICLLDEAINSLMEIQHHHPLFDLLPQIHPFFFEFCATIRSYRQNPANGYKSSVMQYREWFTFGDSLLAALQETNPSPFWPQGNHLGVISCAYFLAIMIVMMVIIPIHLWGNSTTSQQSSPPQTRRNHDRTSIVHPFIERGVSNKVTPSSIPAQTLLEMCSWIDVLGSVIDADEEEYMRYPRAVAKIARGLVDDARVAAARSSSSSSSNSRNASNTPETQTNVSPTDTERTTRSDRYTAEEEDEERAARNRQWIEDALANMRTRAHNILGGILHLGPEITTWFEQFVMSLPERPVLSSPMSMGGGSSGSRG